MGSGIANRPDLGGGPSLILPGLGGPPSAGNLPNAPLGGDRPGAGLGLGLGLGLGASIQDRHARLNDLMNDRHRPLGNPDDLRDRWQAIHDHVYRHHRDWHRGCWHGRWGRGDRLNYWFKKYPVMTTLGVTTWAINRVRWAFGYNDYYNPYYTSGTSGGYYDYSQPIDQSSGAEASGTSADSSSLPPGVSQKAVELFNQAQQKFYDKDYDAALALADSALKEMPNDAVIHEFRALVLFSLGKYQDAAATLYAVLGVGPGWDWATMSGMYEDGDTYNKQLRTLENYRYDHPKDAAAQFVLAYHYITLGHNENASDQLQSVLKLNPRDEVAADLLSQIDPKAKLPEQKEITKPPEDTKLVKSSDLPGTWTARRSNGTTFEMALDDKGAFTWKYTMDGKSQEMSGVYALDDKGVLALNVDNQGTMLAQLDKQSDEKLDFYMVGDTSGSEPLHFAKQ